MALVSTAEITYQARWKKLPLLSLSIVAILLLLILLAPFLGLHSPYEQDLDARLTPPYFAGGHAEYVLGADMLGRDVFSRVLYGGRISLLISILAILVGGGAGGMLGLMAGYQGGRTDTAIMRVADATLAFPIIFLALILVVTIGSSLLGVVLAIGVMMWARFARVIRSEVLSIRERDWIVQAKIIGCSHLRILIIHVLPHVLNTWVVLGTLQLGWVILVEAVLSFLGAGVPPPEPSWGSMIAESRSVSSIAPWIWGSPGLALVLTVLSFNRLGDWLRELLDPKQRQI